MDVITILRAARVAGRARRLWLAGARRRNYRGGVLRFLFCCVLAAPDLAAISVAETTIASIDFICEAPIDIEGLTRLLPMRVGDPLRREDLEESRRRLELTQVFTSIQIEATERPDSVAIEVFLTRKEVVNAIRFRGNSTFGDSDLRRAVRLQEGSPLTDSLREYGVTRLIEYYQEQGFPAVRVAALVQRLAAGEVDVTFEIEEGEPLLITSLLFTGDVPIPIEQLRREITIEEGGRYSKTEAKAAEKELRRALRQYEFFEAEVESSWRLSAESQGTLEFQIDAGPPFELMFSGNHYFGEAAIREQIELLERPIITDGTWREMARRARRAYQAAAFHAARVTTRVEAGSPRRVLFEIEEGQQRWVHEVRFEGNRGLSEEQLHAAMATRPPSWWPWNPGVLIDDVLDDDLKRLWFLYRRYGFQEAQILDARREIDEATGGLVVIVVIGEGVQTLVDEVERVGFAGLDTLPEQRVQKGDPLDEDMVEVDRRALATALFKAGYATAQVDSEVLTSVGAAKNSARVRFEAQPGERHRIGDIFVQNNIDTRARVVLRELPFKKGDPLDPDALLLGQSNIYRLGLFRTVSVRPVDDGPAPEERDIAVNVSERFPGSLQWGFGYNTRDGFRGFAEVGHNNLRGRARRVSLRGDFNFDPSQAQPNEYLGNLGFVEPRLFDTRWLLRTNFIAQQATRSVDQFSIERIAFVPAIERPLLSNLTIGIEMQVESARIFGVKRDVLAFNPRDEGSLMTVGGGPFAVYDGRDDPFQPTRGVFQSLRTKIAPAALGSDVPFFKVVAQHSQYIPLVKDLTFVYSARAGWGRTMRSGEVLPIRERFFLGGRTTVRGFDENVIGPKGAIIYNEEGRIDDRGGNPLGGDLLINANTELRFPIAFGLAGAVFFDAGGVHLQERPIRFEDLRESAGPGLRYATPVGPIGLDFGFKLDRRTGESMGEVHFSIGTIF